MEDDGTRHRGWRTVAPLGGGGQGTTFVAEDDAGRRACLKRLAEDTDSERRARFIREASCYRTLRVAGVPGLVDTNASTASPAGTDPLWICTELVDGPTLGRIVTARLAINDVVAAGVRLAGICDGLHAAGIVHRDIKPDNLIAPGGVVGSLFLVDFGLAFADEAEDDHRTELGQELGNRFLRLPELQAGSRAKQDPVSDLTFCVGVLFFLATGQAPRTLVDAEGRMPHQRSGAATDRLRGSAALSTLLPIFDRGFRLRTSERYQTASELRAALLGHGMGEREGMRSLEEIVADLERPGMRSAMQRLPNCAAVIDVAHDEATSMAGRTNGFFVRTQTGHVPWSSGVETRVGFSRADDHLDQELVRFRAEVVGSEIVLSADDEPILRMDADGAVPAGSEVRTAVHRALLVALEVLAARREDRPD